MDYHEWIPYAWVRFSDRKEIKFLTTIVSPKNVHPVKPGDCLSEGHLQDANWNCWQNVIILFAICFDTVVATAYCCLDYDHHLLHLLTFLFLIA